MMINVPDITEDVDLMLRHTSRQFPEQIAKVLLPKAKSIVVAGWKETQVTSRQRRLDRAMDVTVDGERRLEHIEWVMEMTAQASLRVYEYHTLLSLALVDEGKQPLIQSTVVVLTGPDRRWKKEGEYRTSPPDAPFCGVKYRVEAVYQQRVAQLEAKNSLFWLIFAPLAFDATRDHLARVVEKLRQGCSPRQFEELMVVMVVLADVDQQKRGFREVILRLATKEVVMKNWVYMQGVDQGRKEGVDQGRKEAWDEARQEARQERLKLMVRLVERRLGRSLATTETAAIRRKLDLLGSERVGDVVVDLSPEDLVEWLVDPDGR